MGIAFSPSDSNHEMHMSRTPLADSISADKKLDELYELIEGIEIAMLTTIEADGSLTSRPMATQKRREGVDLWFMTSAETHKTDALQRYPQVNTPTTTTSLGNGSR